jgi:hypothetical protein
MFDKILSAVRSIFGGSKEGAQAASSGPEDQKRAARLKDSSELFALSIPEQVEFLKDKIPLQSDPGQKANLLNRLAKNYHTLEQKDEARTTPTGSS